ncbi:MAG: hypothetical protein GY939_11735 [Actinomycetia bacterium]|nr:hypothetical protein [Actinomycetes bacterium]
MKRIEATEGAAGTAGREWTRFKQLFLVAALWNFAGAVPGFFDSAGSFSREFDRELSDPVMIAVYRGAWGTALLYGFGFLMVAWNPVRHSGVVLMGGIGKAFFAINLLYMYSNGWTSSFALVVIGGDIVFVILFVAYFLRIRQLGHTLI